MEIEENKRDMVALKFKQIQRNVQNIPGIVSGSFDRRRKFELPLIFSFRMGFLK